MSGTLCLRSKSSSGRGFSPSPPLFSLYSLVLWHILEYGATSSHLGAMGNGAGQQLENPNYSTDQHDPGGGKNVLTISLNKPGWVSERLGQQWESPLASFALVLSGFIC